MLIKAQLQEVKKGSGECATSQEDYGSAKEKVKVVVTFGQN